MSTGQSICLTLFLVIANICFAAHFLKGRAHARVGNTGTAGYLYAFGNGSIWSKIEAVIGDDFFDCLLGGLLHGIVLCYGLSWHFSSEGPQHPIISALFFLCFALPFSFAGSKLLNGFLDHKFGRNSMAHVISGGVCCMAVFLLLALGFVTFFCATISLATVGIAFGAVFAVIMLLYFFMAANGMF